MIKMLLGARNMIRNQPMVFGVGKCVLCTFCVWYGRNFCYGEEHHYRACVGSIIYYGKYFMMYHAISLITKSYCGEARPIYCKKRCTLLHFSSQLTLY